MNPSSELDLNARSYYVRWLKHALDDTLSFFDLRTAKAWLKLTGPPLITQVAVWQLLGPEHLLRQIPLGLAVAFASIVWAFIVFLFFLVLAPHRLHSEIAKRVEQSQLEIDKLQDARKPRLAITFQSRDSYVQETSQSLLYRVSVQNLSATTSIESVFVELTNIKPYRPSYLPLRLHLMNDNPHMGQNYQQSFDLAPSEEKFIDLIELYKLPPELKFLIKHSARNVPYDLASPPEILTVVVRGKDCASVTADFALVKQNNTYRLSIVQ
jgi:uncharacterized protein Usg